MSEAPHESPVKTPGQLIAVIIASFAIPIILIVLFANYANHAFRSGAGTDALSDEQVAARIAPIAKVEVKDANAPRTYKTGEEVYKAVCVTCHGTGAAGAPKFGNKDDWAPRISQGFDTLLKTALAGKGAMPARGGTSPDDVSDYEIARAIVYMANNDGANFPEPAAPAANAAQPASGAPASGADASNAQAAAAMAA
ncbi:cytochrome c5 family protein, partial [Burkholderia sp. E168m30]